MIAVIFVFFSLLSGFYEYQLYVGDGCIDPVTNAAGECLPLDACPHAQRDIDAGLKPLLCAVSVFPSIVCCQYQYPQNNEPPPDEADSFDSHMDAFYKTLEADHELTYDLDSPAGGSTPNETISEKKCNAWYPGLLEEQPEDSLKLQEKDDFPHVAALGWIFKNGSFFFKCAGTLISERYVLSAAHCMLKLEDDKQTTPGPAFVRLGVKNITGDGPYNQPIDVNISEIIKHPKFKPPSKYYDIALVKLAKILPMNSRLRPACLWTEPKINIYRGAFATGWGSNIRRMMLPGLPTKKNETRKNKNETVSAESSPVLQKVAVEVLETRICQQLLYFVYSRRWVGLRGHQLCAGVMATSARNQNATCQGDPGGALQVRTRRLAQSVYFVVGVTSRDQCGLQNKPGIYTRVSSFVPWIESIVWPPCGVHCQRL